MREKTALSQHYFTSFACSNFFRRWPMFFGIMINYGLGNFWEVWKYCTAGSFFWPAAISPGVGGGDGVAYRLDVWSINNPVVPPPGQLWSRVFDAQLKYKFFQQALEWRRTNNQKVLETISVQTLRFTSSDLVVRQQKKLTVSISIKCTKW